MNDPFKITGPAVISFSGGRTSGYMTWKTIKSHGGTLPPHVIIVFCNTGKERPETLDFVERCSQQWGVEIVWLEYRHNGKPTFAVVDYATASRNGEPFVTAITAPRGDSGYLPNPLVRYCTIELKIKTLIRYLKKLGWSHWTNAIGFRADEPQRVAKSKSSDKRESREDAVFPLYQSGVTKQDVELFWDNQSFNLKLRPDESNCDLCFLKGAGKLQTIMRSRPDLAQWWINQEERHNTRFRNDRPRYSALLELSKRPQIPGMEDESDELSIACHCTD